MSRARTAGIIIASLILLASCGGSSQSSDIAPSTTGKIDPKYATFCAASSKLNAAMTGPHGESPAAITDPAEMKTAWASITTLSRALVAATPTELKTDAAKMMTSINAMDDIFKANDYNLLAMSKMPEVRIELNDISADVSVQEASARFNTFLTKTCPK